MHSRQAIVKAILSTPGGTQRTAKGGIERSFHNKLDFCYFVLASPHMYKHLRRSIVVLCHRIGFAQLQEVCQQISCDQFV
jgi:hypothetical protein